MYFLEQDVHPNVGTSIAKLAEIEKEEDERAYHLNRMASKQQRFFLSYAKSFFSPQVFNFSFDGEWTLTESVKVKVTQKDSNLYF